MTEALDVAIAEDEPAILQDLKETLEELGHRVVVAAKTAEILVMCLGVVAFFFYRSSGLTGAFVVLGLMGMQSAFFGPSKYGILPEMLRERDENIGPATARHSPQVDDPVGIRLAYPLRNPGLVGDF